MGDFEGQEGQLTGQASPRLSFRLPLDPARLLRARHRIRDYLHEARVEPEDVDAVVLSLEEAMTNAVRHSRANEDLEVGLWVEGADLFAEVRDRGAGFDVDSFDPEQTPDLMGSGGRGLFLMGQLMDELRLSCDGGLEVRLVKRGVVTAGSGESEPHTLRSTVPDFQDYRDRRQRAFLEEIDEAFAALDWQFRYLYVNERATRLSGRSADELIGKTLWEAFPDIVGSEVERWLREAMELGVPKRYEFYFAPLERWFEQRIYPTASGISQFSVEITERKRKEAERDELHEALQVSEERFRLLHDTMLQGVVYQDAAGAILSMNPAAERILGKRPEDFLGLTSVGVEHDTLREDGTPFPGLEHPAMVALRTGRPVPNVLMQVYNPREAQYRLINIQAVPLRRPGETSPYCVYTVFDDVTSLKQAEEALRQSELRLRIATAATGLGVQDYDMRTGTVVWDERVRELWGVGPNEPVSYETFIEAVHPEDREAIQAAVQTCMDPKGCRESSTTYRVIDRSDGTERWVRATWETLFEGDEAVRMVGTVEDVTAQRRAEQELQDSRAELVATLDAIKDGFYRLDQDWRVTYLNDKAAAIFPGGKRALGADFFELFPEAAGTDFETSKRRAMEHGEMCAYESYYPPFEAWFEERDYPGADGITVLFTDITERKRTQEALRESEERFRVALRNAPVSVALQDRDLRYVWAYNQGAAQPEQIIGKTDQEIFSAQAAQHITACKRRVLDEGIELRERMWLEGSNGPIFVDITWEPHRNAAGEVVGVTSATVDLTASKLAEERLQAQGEELQAQNEELATQSEELADQAEELRRQGEELTQHAHLGEALNTINSLLHSTMRPEEVLQRALDEGVRALGVECGTIEMRGHGGGWIVRYQHGFDPATVDALLADELAPNAVAAEASRDVIAIRDMRGTPSDVGFVREQRLRSVLAVPLIVQERVIACLLFYHRVARSFTEPEGDFARKLGAAVALALENARLYEELATRERFSAALTEVDSLIHSTLKVEEIMQGVVAAALDVVGADSAIVALRHGEDWVAEYGHPEVPGVIHESVRSEEAPFMLTAVTERRPVAIDDCESDPRCYPEVQRRFGVRSVLCVPLIAHDEVLGVIFFNHHRATVPFDAQTVDFAARLAASISIALQNASLFAEQQRIAATLQENLMHELPVVAGLELGLVSRTAHAPDLVGGDFSDAFVLDDGRVAILIGDVAGKGLAAAGLTETVRSTVRAFAAIDPAPAFVLERTNELLLHRDLDQPHVTACYCLLDPRTGHMACASAGHPAPIHLGSQACQTLGMGFGMPLGSFSGHYEAEHVRLTLDDYLVLYTDGLTEARRARGLYGEKRLLKAVSRLRGLSAQELADSVVADVESYADRLADDLQVLALRLT